MGGYVMLWGVTSGIVRIGTRVVSSERWYAHETH